MIGDRMDTSGADPSSALLARTDPYCAAVAEVARHAHLVAGHIRRVRLTLEQARHYGESVQRWLIARRGPAGARRQHDAGLAAPAQPG